MLHLIVCWISDTTGVESRPAESPHGNTTYIPINYSNMLASTTTRSNSSIHVKLKMQSVIYQLTCNRVSPNCLFADCFANHIFDFCPTTADWSEIQENFRLHRPRTFEGLCGIICTKKRCRNIEWMLYWGYCTHQRKIQTDLRFEQHRYFFTSDQGRAQKSLLSDILILDLENKFCNFYFLGSNRHLPSDVEKASFVRLGRVLHSESLLILQHPQIQAKATFVCWQTKS